MLDNILQFTPQEYQRRFLKVRAGMQLRDIDCLIIAGNDAFYGSFASTWSILRDATLNK